MDILGEDIHAVDEHMLLRMWVLAHAFDFDSTGHPIGATGLGQCAEICWQVDVTCQYS